MITFPVDVAVHGFHLSDLLRSGFLGCSSDPKSASVRCVPRPSFHPNHKNPISCHSFLFRYQFLEWKKIETHIWPVLFTSWCLWPAVRPMADACWGTSLHQRSPAALCPAVAAGGVLLLPLQLFSLSRVACGTHCLQGPPTGEHFI